MSFIIIIYMICMWNDIFSDFSPCCTNSIKIFTLNSDTIFDIGTLNWAYVDHCQLRSILTKPLISHYENRIILLANLIANIQKSDFKGWLQIGYYLEGVVLCLMIPIKDLRKQIFQRCLAVIVKNSQFFTQNNPAQ